MADLLAKNLKRSVVWIMLFVVVLVCTHRPSQRFVPNPENLSIALDSETGKMCRTTPLNQDKAIPLCTDLKKWWQR